MNISVIGAGYVGLVTGACFADLGNHVTCIDISHEKIANLKKGMMPIYEPGLETIINANIAAGRLQFVSALTEQQYEPQVIIIAVGTPSDQDGSADLQYVLEAAKNIGSYINHYCVIVDKSTVPVGMAERVEQVIFKALHQRGKIVSFDVVSNPEFLREGAAIDDFMRPDRVIIGCSSEKSRNIMLDLYLPLIRNPEKLYFMNVKDAEMTKYVANAMLATRISFMNEMAALCEKMDVDIENVRLGIGSDSRIGTAFLYPGCGYGGSCFPKDVKALIKMAEQHQIEPQILHAVVNRNEQQKKILFEKITQVFGEDLSQIKIALWGLSFKPDTDDLREASSLVLLQHLMSQQVQVQAHDPVAMPAARRILPATWFTTGRLQLFENQYDVLKDADALVLVTEWKPFRYPDIAIMKQHMRRHIIFDGRNQYDPRQMREAGFSYHGMGRGQVTGVKIEELASVTA